jgi:hypothetical protein
VTKSGRNDNMTKIVNLNLRFWIEFGPCVSLGRLHGFRRRESPTFHLKCPAGRTSYWQYHDSQWFINNKHGVSASYWFFATCDYFLHNFIIFHPTYQPQGFDFSPVTCFTRLKLNHGRKKSQKNAANEDDGLNRKVAKVCEAISRLGASITCAKAPGDTRRTVRVGASNPGSAPDKIGNSRMNALNIFLTRISNAAERRWRPVTFSSQ